MKIRTDKALKAMKVESAPHLAVLLGYTRQAGYKWGKYLSELATRRLVEREPKLARLVEYD